MRPTAARLDPTSHLENIGRVSSELSSEAALFFAREMRDARAKALADAEGWQDLIYVFERLAKFATRSQKTTIGNRDAKSIFSDIINHGFPRAHQQRLLLDQVIEGRNSEFHGGAAARRFARHCVEFSFLLEDGLKNFMNKTLGSIMSSPVISVEPWQMQADVRRLMLENSFTWVPIKEGNIWRVASDHALVVFLRDNREAIYSKTLRDSLAGSNPFHAPTLGIFNENTETNHEVLQEALAQGPVLVSAEGISPDRVVGIVTAFDLL